MAGQTALSAVGAGERPLRVGAPAALPRLILRRVRQRAQKSKAPDFSEARPDRRAGYIRPRRHQFLHRHDDRRRPL
jgi:hypothetical protein